MILYKKGQDGTYLKPGRSITPDPHTLDYMQEPIQMEVTPAKLSRRQPEKRVPGQRLDMGLLINKHHESQDRGRRHRYGILNKARGEENKLAAQAELDSWNQDAKATNRYLNDVHKKELRAYNKNR